MKIELLSRCLNAVLQWTCFGPYWLRDGPVCVKDRNTTLHPITTSITLFPWDFRVDEDVASCLRA